MTYAHNPAGKWTNQHQMSINNKRDNFNLPDLTTVADSISLNKGEDIIHEVVSAIEKWPEFAELAGVQPKAIEEIKSNHRLL